MVMNIFTYEKLNKSTVDSADKSDDPIHAMLESKKGMSFELDETLEDGIVKFKVSKEGK